MSLARALSAYAEAILRARRAGLALSAQQAARVLGAVETYARRLQIALANLPPGAAQERAAMAVRLHDRIAELLARELGEITERGVTTTVARVQSIMERATFDVLRAADMSPTFFRRMETDVVASFLARGPVARDFRTLIRAQTAEHASAVDRILADALAAGADTETLGRRLRQHIEGADDAALQPYYRDGILDLRRVPPDLQAQARSIAWKARRIAITESFNAQRDATLSNMERAPHVGAARWTLSLERGPTARYDQCDVLASTDFYGLGKGVYPLSRWPLEHPFGKCFPTPVYRPAAEWGQPRREPRLNLDAASGVSPSILLRVTEALAA